MPPNTNALRRLAQQFEALPRQQELKQAKIHLSTTCQKVTENADSLEASFGRIATLREMQGQPALLAAELAQKVKTLRTTTQILEQQVQAARVTERLTGALDTLSKSSKALSDQVAQAWNTADTEILDATQALIDLTGRYDVTAQRELQQALTRFKASRNPQDAEGVAHYRRARAEMQQARMALNIPGKVGQFLSESVRGTGSARALLDPEIQGFLRAHPDLWPRLTVKLG
jgi:hypothetical protein